MLQNMRESFTGKFAFALLVLIGLSFVFVGLNYSFIGSTNAAKVDGEEILAGAFEQRYRDAIQANPTLTMYEGELRVEVRRLLLDQLIQGQLIQNFLNENGYRISDEQLTANIQGTPEFQIDGRFDMEAYRQFLLLRNRTPEEFEPEHRNSLRQQQLELSVVATAIVTPAEYRRYLNLIAEQRVVTIATIDQAAVEDELIVTDDMIEAFYNENQAFFMSEDSADVDYIRVSRRDLAAGISPSEDELVAWYDQNQERYKQDEQRSARHILIIDADDAEARAQAAYDRVLAGEAFETVAAELSEDTGTASQGGDLGTRTEGDFFVDELRDAVFDMSVGEVRGPIESDFGFHVVRLDEIAEQGYLPFEEARDDVLSDVRGETAFDIYRQLERDLSNALFDSSDIQQIAESVGQTVETVEGFTRLAGGGPFGANQAAIDAIFEEIVLTGGQISEVTELDADSMAIFSVTQFNPASPKALADVRDEIDNSLRAEQAQTIMSNRVESALAAVADGADFGVASEAAGMTMTEPQLLTRGDQSVDSSLMFEIFAAAKPEQDSPVTGSARTTDGSIAIYSLASVLPGRPESIPLPQRDAGKLALAQDSGRNDFGAFIRSMYDEADIQINEDVLAAEDMFQ